MTDDKYEALEAALSPPPEQEDAFRSALRRAEDALENNRRFQIGRWIVALYCFVIGSTAAYLIVFSGLWQGVNTFSDLAELIKIAVIPIVTLVIGFYFGSSASR